MRTRIQQLGLWMSLLFGVAACPGPTPATVAVTISPTTATVAAGGTQQFTATVTGASNTQVNWSASGGTISGAGLFTAPASAGSVTVTATSVADSTKSAQATVTVTSTQQTVSVSVSPSSTQVNPGQQVTFTATVTGSANTQVSWSVQEQNGGTVTSAGVYTAPSALGQYTVIATSAADPTKQGTATVTVTNNPVVTVTISPKTATVSVGGQQSFSATITGNSNTQVTWSVLESGGGTVSNGAYTAPASAGTYHVVATSVADSSKSDSAEVTVTTSPVVSVSLNPSSANLTFGQQQVFTATVSGTGNTGVSWSLQPASGSGTLTPSGNTASYTAPSSPGAFQVIATSVADNTKSASATVNVAPPPPPSLSGTVSYSGSPTGRLYVTVDWGGPGTSLMPSGTSTAFTIRGLEGQGYSVQVNAWMDVLGTGVYNYAADPQGSATINLTGSSISGVNIALSPPPAATAPRQPSQPFVVPHADSVIVVGNDDMRDSQGRFIATATRFYWSTTPNPGPSNKASGAPKVVPVASGPGVVYLGSPDVAAGGTYYFSVSAVNGTLEGPVSSQVGPITVSAPSGGTTVSGQVSFAGITPTGPFIVGIYSQYGGAYYTKVSGTTSPGSFSIGGVAPDTYQLFATIDQNGDGLLGIAEPSVGFDGPGGTMVTVGASPVTGLSLTVPAGDGIGRVMTSHSKYGAGLDRYSLVLWVGSNAKRPVKVVLTSGPNLAVPVDVGLAGWSPGQHRLRRELGATVPSTGQSYSFDVTYEGGSTGTLSAQVTGVVTGLPTPISPTGTIATMTPTFNWSLPGSLPSPYSQRIWVGGQGGGSGWDYELGPGQTSVTYNADGRAPSLTSGMSYSWDISILDQYGNEARAGLQFSVQ